ncbi:glycerophosphodiester phosphodiesterase [candidate division KSB1 bacterium]
MDNFQIVAHRGASGEAPENTIAAIRKAVDYESDRIEIDVQQTRDGRVVVLHDTTLDRTTDGTGPVNRFNYDELKPLDAGSWFDTEFRGERIPLLEEVLELVKAGTGIIIELKSGSQLYPDIEKKVWSIIQYFKLEESTVISSSRVTVLNTLKSVAPDAKLGKIITPKELWRSLFQDGSLMFKQGLINHIKELHPHWSFVDNQFMEWAKSHDLSVIPWTVNKERKMRAMIDRGVHGIITDFPDLAHKFK